MANQAEEYWPAATVIQEKGENQKKRITPDTLK
jgi:hypothetical protein